MSIHTNELRNGLYLITQPVPVVGAQPFDSLTIDYTAQPHFLLQRHLDEYDVQVILDRTALQEVPDSLWDTIPPRSLLRRRRGHVVAARQVASGLRLV